MKLATYNIWEDNKNFDIRLDLLVNEINKYDIDLFALQEVRDENTFNYIKEKTSFKNGFFFEGLAFLSNLDIKVCTTYAKDNNYFFRVSCKDIGFTTVHFDWQRPAVRKTGLEEYFRLLDTDCLETEFVLGDFNEDPEEKIHYELVSYDFIDLHKEYAHSNNEYPLPTLDIINNPRWRHIKTDEEPKRFDWVMLNTLKTFELNNVKLIGTEEVNDIAPSDHYGVLVDVKI